MGTNDNWTATLEEALSKGEYTYQNNYLGKEITGFKDGEREILSSELKTFLVSETRFNFLNDHYGLRPGQIHLLLSTAGVGKSSLVRGILGDLISSGVETLFFSTEETERDFKINLADSGFLLDDLRFMRFLHEDTLDDYCDGNFALFKAAFKMALEELINNKKIKVLIFDNITMCSFYDDIKTNMAFCKFLIQTIRELNVAAFLVVHTTKHVRQNQYDFDTQDVKGSSFIANRAELMYGLRVFRTKNDLGKLKTRAFVHIMKSRFHPITGNYYELDYSPAFRRYIKDESIEEGAFEDAHRAFVKNRTNKK